jgi:hypothetical protein
MLEAVFFISALTALCLLNTVRTTYGKSMSMREARRRATRMIVPTDIIQLNACTLSRPFQPFVVASPLGFVHDGVCRRCHLLDGRCY